MQSNFFATAPPFVGDLVAAELTALGCTPGAQSPLGVHFTADPIAVMRCCIWSRFANRILQPLAQGVLRDDGDLYDLLKQQPWDQWMHPGDSLRVRTHTHGDGPLGHSHYAALRCKDAIVDVLRERANWRPNIDLKGADLTVDLHLAPQQAGTYAASLSLMVCRSSLHRRGYRPPGAQAPLKENLAAAILQRSGWPAPGPLVDPLCGSATLLIEGAMSALDKAPGPQQVAAHWARQWPTELARLQAEASARYEAGAAAARVEGRRFYGFDIDPAAIRLAESAVERAGLREFIQLVPLDMRRLPKPAEAHGHLVSNPPYGERLAPPEGLEAFYTQLGAVLRQRFAGWSAHLLLQDPELGHRLGMRASRQHRLRNGPLDTTLLHFTVPELPAAEPQLAELKQRLEKNWRQRQRWASRQGIGGFRLYDRDLPQFAVAIDLYQDADSSAWYAVIQEYRAPSEIPPARAAARLRAVLHCLPEVIPDLPMDHLILKERRKHSGRGQYGPQGRRGLRLQIAEPPNRFWVNLTDYLDCGIFLDQRQVRQWVAEMAAGQAVLNLFAYTGTASVSAAAGGAKSTLSVDLSSTYLGWAAENFRLAGLDQGAHRLVQAEAVGFLESCDQSFDLILIDPPTFANSKGLETDFDLQRDHAAMLLAGMRCLRLGGTLIFSHHARRFLLDPSLEQDFTVDDRSLAATPTDFDRSQKGHRCYFIRHPGRRPPRRSPTESA